MGTRAHLVTVGANAAELASQAEQTLAALERRWSRFLPNSEITKLNGAKGKPTLVSADTFRVITAAVEAWCQTEGLFDPTIHRTLCALGYDRSFEQLCGDGFELAEPTPPQVATDRPDSVLTAAPGCAGIRLFEGLLSVQLPPDVTLDLGGIAKGAAADLVARETMAAGADGVCVNIGGDLRVMGHAPTSAGWIVALDLPGVTEPRRVAINEGAVCTSTTARRRWRQHGETRHHLIDPRDRSAHHWRALGIGNRRARCAGGSSNKGHLRRWGIACC